jgi:hypothetical protein
MPEYFSNIAAWSPKKIWGYIPGIKRESFDETERDIKKSHETISLNEAII